VARKLLGHETQNTVLYMIIKMGMVQEGMTLHNNLLVAGRSIGSETEPATLLSVIRLMHARALPISWKGVCNSEDVRRRAPCKC
jgi:hypothetical protein